MSKQQKTILFTIIIFLLGGLALAAYLARQIAKPTPRAEENRVIFTLQTTNPTPDTGDEMTVSLFARAPVNTAIRTLSAYITYDPNLVEVVPALAEAEDNDGVYRSNEDPFVDWSYVKTKNNTQDSRIEILASYRPLEAVSPDNPKLLNYDDGAPLFATIQFRWKGGDDDSTALELITDPATSGAKDPDGNDVTVAPSSLVIPVSVETPSPSPKNPVTWETNYVALEADDFYIIAGDEKYLANTEPTRVTSDPGNDTYTTLEVEWPVKGTQMRLYMYFRSDGEKWWTYEIRTYDGSDPGNWIYYTQQERLFETELGTGFIGDIDLESDPDNEIGGMIHFENLHLQAFLGQTIATPTPTPGFPPDKPVLYLFPPRGRASAGEMFTTTIFLNTGGNDVSGVDAVLTFDPDVLNVVSTERGNIPKFISYFKKIDDEAGSVTVSALISPDTTEPIPTEDIEITPGIRTAQSRRDQTPVNGQGLKFATVTFKALPIIEAQHIPPESPAILTEINFDFTPGEKNDSNIAEFHKGGDILDATYGAKYRISFEPIEGTSLKLRLELCDESSQRKVYLTLPNDTLIETNLNGENEDKVHTTEPVNIPEGTQSLNVRVAGYLAHTFQLPPDWTNLIDLSSFTLLGGDLDGSGKVNVLDFNLFKSDYLKAEETPADLDCSDQVNSLDYDGIIRNWNKESD